MSEKRKTSADPDLIKRTAKAVGKGITDRADAYLEGSYDPKKEAGKALLKGGATAFVVLSLLTGLAFSNTAEINDDQINAQLTQPPIALDIDDYANADVDDDDEAGEEKTARGSIISRFRQALLSLPAPVRLLVITPLWAIGTALMTLVAFLWNTLFSSPLGAFIASVAMGFAVLLGLFTVTAKTLFPDVPLRKIICRRNLIMLAVAALILSAIDAAAPLFWHQYPAVSALVKISLGGGAVGLLSIHTKNLFRRTLLQSA